VCRRIAPGRNVDGSEGGMTNLPESDWRVLRSVHRAALDRYCARVLDECERAIRGPDRSAHDRYLRLAAAFDDLRRSTAIQRLAAMIGLGVVTEAELGEFTAPTRESATGWAELWQPGATPKAPRR
jgi:hypothetical protein